MGGGGGGNGGREGGRNSQLCECAKVAVVVCHTIEFT
jgi:hypothetical protein